MAKVRRAPGLDLTEDERGRLRAWLGQGYASERYDYEPPDSDPILTEAIRKLLEFVGGEPVRK